MDELLKQRIERAKVLIRTARNAAMATVNEDCSPHNTPFFFIHSEQLERIYWGSHPEALHSKNINRTGQIFLVIYESSDGGGLYIKANDAKELTGSELSKGLEVHNNFRKSEGKDPLPLSYYSGSSPQRMYSASPTNFYVNVAERDEKGNIIKDLRREISRADLFDN